MPTIQSKLIGHSIKNPVICICVGLCLLNIAALPAYSQLGPSEAAAVCQHVNKGNYCMARNLFEQAVSEYDAALDVDPDSIIAKENLVAVYNNWGLWHFRQRKWSEAQAAWEEALEISPNDRTARRNILVLKATLAHLGASPLPPTEQLATVERGTSPTSAMPWENPWRRPTSMVNNATAPVTSRSANLDDQLAAIEIKVCGCKQNMPLTQRIEKLEALIFGQIRSGNLQERIATLLQ